MKTFLGNNNHPYITVELVGKKSVQTIDCMIDTGFAGGIAIPDSLKDQLDFPVILKQEWSLADGSRVELDVHLGKIRVNNTPQEIGVIYVGSTIGLIGIEFLMNKILTVDLKRKAVELVE